jgi:hypothetical protein
MRAFENAKHLMEKLSLLRLLLGNKSREVTVWEN